MQVADAVHAEVANIRKSLPKGITLQPFYDQSDLVRASIKSVRDAILIGLLLAAIILVLFLRDWGSSIVAGLVIPVTVAVTFIALRVLGESFNLMTLGGLAAAVGLVIDDAIVVVENIVMHRDAGQSRGEAIASAMREIRVPLIGSTVTPIVVFLPLISMTGVTGTFFRALAITVSVALLTSLGLALTWTPTLSHYFLRKPKEEAQDAGLRRGLLGRVMNVYERVLRIALDHRWALALFSVALIAASYFCYRALGSDLLPEMDEGGFILDYLTPAGSSLEETNRVMVDVERILRETPEVENITRRTGLQLGLATVTEANRGDFTVKLKPDRKKGVEEVIADVREKVTKLHPTLQIEFPQLLQDMIGDLTSAPEPIVIKMFSQNPDLLRQWAPQVADAHQKDSRRGGRPQRHRQHHQRTGCAVSCGPSSGGARRLYSRRSRVGCQRDPARRACAASGGSKRPRLYNSSPLSRRHASVDGGDSQHASHQPVRKPGDARIAGHSGRTAGSDRDRARESTAHGGCHGAAGGHGSGHGNRKGKERCGQEQPAGRNSRSVRRRL